ncbi:hypothetical protein X975_27250, partial [Stegodyphus mimosarum]
MSSIQRISVPTNLKKVQSFLQTCSWFRNYLQTLYGHLVTLPKIVQWICDPEQTKAFKELKKILINVCC